MARSQIMQALPGQGKNSEFYSMSKRKPLECFAGKQPHLINPVSIARIP
jgi:hypothetical protein